MSPPTRRTPGADPGFAQVVTPPSTTDEAEGTAAVNPADVCADPWSASCWTRQHETAA